MESDIIMGLVPRIVSTDNNNNVMLFTNKKITLYMYWEYLYSIVVSYASPIGSMTSIID